jgi:hypothetical protein
MIALFNYLRFSTRWRKWLFGVGSGFIGGAAAALHTSVALILMNPETFNLGPQLGHTLLTAFVLGTLCGLQTVFAYLKQSPLPPPSTGETEHLRLMKKLKNGLVKRKIDESKGRP